jgi:photosystem II stability/assembly factor-like uncharacterized protein
MKKVTTILLIVISIISLSSCKSDIIDEFTEEANGECMGYINLHDITHDARHIFFLNNQEGWMIGSTSGNLLQGNPMLLHTTDSGQNWTVINNNIGSGAFGMYANGSQFKFQFTNSTHGYMSLDFPMNGYEDELYYYTNDGGVSWNPVPLPTLGEDEDIYLYGMGVNSTKMVFAALVVNANSDIPSCYRLYYVSNTTHTVTNYIDIECYLLEDHKNFKPRDIHFADNGVINMSATSSQNPYTEYMAHSGDYGASWTYTEVEHLPYDHSYIQFVNNSIGYMAINSGAWSETVPFYKTTDGGITWVKKTVSIDGGLGFYQFSFADENNGLAIRFSDNALYKTTNGGDSWERVSCFNDKQLAVDIHTTPQNIYYPSVDNGIILTTWMDVDATEDADMYQNRMYFYKGE